MRRLHSRQLIAGKDTPGCNRLYELLREPLRSLIPNDARYEEASDRFEYLLTLTFLKPSSSTSWLPIVGFTGSQATFSSLQHHVSATLAKECAADQNNWEPAG